MTKVTIKDDDIIPYGIVKEKLINKTIDIVNKSLITLTLILKNTDKLLSTLDSVKNISDTFIIFNNTTNKSVIEEYCNTHNITLHIKEKLGEKEKGFSKTFQTKEEANKFTWDIITNNFDNIKYHEMLYSEVIELDSIFKD